MFKAVIGSPYNPNAELLAVRQFIVHPEYNCDSVQNDIVLIELDKSVKKSGCTLPTTQKALPENTTVTVMGYGWTNEDIFQGTRPEILQKAHVTVISNDRCQDWYGVSQKTVTITGSQLCAGLKEGGRDACWADSGGPLIDADGTLVGIVSTGVGCGRKMLPGIYTRVSRYTEWINSIVNNE